MSQGSAAPQLNRVPDRRPRPCPLPPVLSQALSPSSHSTGSLQAEPTQALWPLGLQPTQLRHPTCKSPRLQDATSWAGGPLEQGCSGATLRLAMALGPCPRAWHRQLLETRVD